MSGINKGVQANIIQKQPLADYVYCDAHCCNLVMIGSCESSRAVKKCFGMGLSTKNLVSDTKVFIHIHENVVRGPFIGKIKPLCLTR